MPSGGKASDLAGMGGVFNPFNLGLYTYAHHNPVRYGDPDGKETVGELIEAKAMEAAQGGHDAQTYGWAFAATAWGALGAENVSKIADGGAITGGVMLGAVLETATLGKGKYVAEGMKLVAGQGGRFSSLVGKVGDELTAHHIPQAALKLTNRAEGGAVVMTAAEHEATRTFGSKGAKTAIEDAGKSFRDVLAKDIRDVRSIVGSAYNKGLQDVTKYYKENFPQLMNKE